MILRSKILKLIATNNSSITFARTKWEEMVAELTISKYSILTLEIIKLFSKEIIYLP